MALRTLGTSATTSLRALNAWATSLSDADIAAIAQTITGDGRFAANLPGGSAGATAVLTTGATHSNTTLDTLVSTGGAGLASIMVGDLVLAADVLPGTFVARRISATSMQLSQAATGSNAERVAFVRANAPHLSRNAQLMVPGGRGIIKVLPGDIVAIDNLGWPILVSAASIAYSGSQWTLT